MDEYSLCLDVYMYVCMYVCMYGRWDSDSVARERKADDALPRAGQVHPHQGQVDTKQ